MFVWTGSARASGKKKERSMQRIVIYRIPVVKSTLRTESGVQEIISDEQKNNHLKELQTAGSLILPRSHSSLAPAITGPKQQQFVRLLARIDAVSMIFLLLCSIRRKCCSVASEAAGNVTSLSVSGLLLECPDKIVARACQTWFP